MKAACEDCGATLLTDQTADVSIVYRCSCGTRGTRNIRVHGTIRNGRIVLRDGLPDEIVTVTA